jgi:hypothetical protein
MRILFIPLLSTASNFEGGIDVCIPAYLWVHTNILAHTSMLARDGPRGGEVMNIC